MPKLSAIYMPMTFPEVIGLNKRIGDFWIGYYDNDGTESGTIRITIKVPADDADLICPARHFFATMHVVSDSIKTLHDLDARGFLSRFENIDASTFYDVLQCLEVAGVPLMSHDGDNLEYSSRAMYELLHEDN